jgi:hypothetical protein
LKYRVIAEFTDGTAAYCRQREKPTEAGADQAACRKARYTQLKQFALSLTQDRAEEMASRLNGVKALGQCHTDVSYFRAGF